MPFTIWVRFRDVLDAFWERLVSRLTGSADSRSSLPWASGVPDGCFAPSLAWIEPFVGVKRARLEAPVAEAGRPYLSYLLRLWQVDGAKPMWRASLESVGTGARHGFATLEALFDFLEAETQDSAAEEEWLREADRLAEGPPY